MISRKSQKEDRIATGRSLSFRLALTLLALLVPAQCISIAAQGITPREQAGHARSSLAEIRNKRSALLVVFRSRVVDANNGERAIIDLVLKAYPRPSWRYRWVYETLAQKLNRYVRKYKSLSAARELDDADYVIFFNLVEYRTILNTSYPYGELFVIVKGTPELQKPPRVIWRSKKVLYAGDAIGNLIRELKCARGES